jgi:hypothetical protein
MVNASHYTSQNGARRQLVVLAMAFGEKPLAGLAPAHGGPTLFDEP